MRQLFGLIFVCALASSASAQFDLDRAQNSEPMTSASASSPWQRLGEYQIGSDQAYSDSVTTLVVAQTRPGQIIYLTPLGIGLETWSYPLQTDFLDVEVDGETARMAYMDSAPPRMGIGTMSGSRPQTKPIPVLLLHGKTSADITGTTSSGRSTARIIA